MTRLRTFLRAARYLFLSAACWLAVHAGSVALAAADADAEEEGGGGWVVSYGLVILGAGLGLLVVLHASRRRERARPEVYESSKRGVAPEYAGSVPRGTPNR